MLASLKTHPFAVEAFFESSMVLTFAVKKEELESFIPECLSLDTFEDTWAFMAIAMVQTKNLRPKGFPKFMGRNFFLIGYRIFVRYKNNAGKRLIGLYIIKSETNKKAMQFFGNIFTNYNYTTTDIIQKEDKNIIKTQSIKSDFNMSLETSSNDEVSLPEGSPFNTWKEARRYAGPLPFTFHYNKDKNKVLIIEGVRQNWIPKPIKVIDYHFSFLDSLNLKSVNLANAFIIQNIPYYWKKGRFEIWKK